MACVFVLPRVILHYQLAQLSGKDTDVVKLLSIKLFRFGLLMFLLALSSGVWLWLGLGIGGKWLFVKLILVFLLLCYFLISGWLLILTIRQKNNLSSLALRFFNETSLLFVIPIIYLAVSKNA